MSNCIQAIFPRPEGTYLCVWNERVSTESMRHNSADILFGDIALESIPREDMIDGGVYPPLYEIWNGIVRNRKAIKRPIIFNLFDKTIKYGGHNFPLTEDHNAIMMNIEATGDIYYG